ncbi:MAG: molybdopterin-dependent oxidoreductase [Candidatus Aminicenantes bacterium]|nr:molybdopterin-dependent oxidoreductase [Candidatus Aminicenantes bacterium]
MSKRKMSRRKFMKTGLVWVTGTAAGFSTIQSGTDYKKITAVSRTSLKPLRAIPTTCEQCPAGCGVIAYLDGERLVQILGNPNHPNNHGSICAKGLAGINLVNDPERLLFPMKRLGSRGDGQWKRITWDEVYSTLEKRINEMLQKNRTSEFVVDFGYEDPLLDRFTAALGLTHIIDRPTLKNLNHDTAFTSMIGSPSLIEDIGRSRTILNFGANPYANHDHFLGLAQRLVLAQVEKGARLVTFDVRMSETAAKSDTWYPIKAGTDSIVALAMAKVIVEKGLADNSFLNQKTNFSLSKLKDHLSRFTLKAAEKESNIKAADIEHLAVEFATLKPSIAIIGGGISDQKNGFQNVRSIALLNWLIGNLEKEGGLFFPRLPGKNQQTANPLYKLRPKQRKNFKELEESSTRINTYFAYLSNPAYSNPDCESTKTFLKDEKKVPFLVVMDTHFTETAMVADMVLPAATYLEGWGLCCAPPLDMFPILNLRQPVVSLLSTAEVLRSPAFEVGKLLEPSFQPKGEAKEVGNFCLELSRRIGGKTVKALPFKDTKDYVSKVFSSIPNLKKQKDFNNLKSDGFWVDTSLKKYNQSSTSSIPPIQAQKVEIYSNKLKQNNHSPLPEYQSIAKHEKKKGDEFILTTFKSNLSARGTANSKWTQEILHENRLWINKDVANRLGIKNGNRVRISSPVGSLTVRVLVTNRIHPNSVALAEGFGHTAVGNIAKAKRFKSYDRDTNLLWWDKKGNGVNPNEIIERKIDPIGGGPCLKDTVVRIEKI